ncbi:hypothetical protein MYP_3542 [Sporocytophaga myxococcoides]|uniref:Uncharacterized protein n=1 Tax=Sporocytophaga myxococcoides TaxID=153721 RepID=A0A098LJR5_9BACT|nr:hypothetical protein MYP_3542 [Sporocytophaga myxococcoides]
MYVDFYFCQEGLAYRNGNKNEKGYSETNTRDQIEIRNFVKKTMFGKGYRR